MPACNELITLTSTQLPFRLKISILFKKWSHIGVDCSQAYNLTNSYRNYVYSSSLTMTGSYKKLIRHTTTEPQIMKTASTDYYHIEKALVQQQKNIKV